MAERKGLDVRRRLSSVECFGLSTMFFGSFDFEYTALQIHRIAMFRDIRRSFLLVRLCHISLPVGQWWVCSALRLRVAAAFFPDADRSAALREAAALPPILPPFSDDA